MRKYESITGHIRCTVYRARLLAGTLRTGSIDVHTVAGCRAFRPVKPLGLTVIGPSGPIARL